MRLNEWQYMNSSSTNSTGYKKRFEKLIKYHIDHASSELESITTKNIKENGFHLGEHYNTGSSEFDRNIVVSFIKNTDEFIISIYVDNKEVYSTQVKGYDNCVAVLEAYMFLPNRGTQDYDDLLTEWVAMKGSQTSSTPQASSTSKTNKEKFEELTDYMKAHINSSVEKAEVVRLDEGGFTYKEHWRSNTGKTFVLTLLVGYSRFDSSWRYELYMDTNLIKEVKGSGWEDLLEELEKYFHVPKAGSPEHKSICESVSFAEDFKLYENLWN